jgi:pyruvate dehydrogenase E2 component (dihydrolipoamide acetyltransferase)
LSTAIEVRVPDLGNTDKVSVIDVLVKVGDAVEVDTPLTTLETDKATMDVPSTSAGVVEAVHVAKGGQVASGDLVVTLRGTGAAIAPKANAAAAAPPPAIAPAPVAVPKQSAPIPGAAAEPPREVPPGTRTDLAPIDEFGFSRAHASPSVRKFARELGVDLSRVKGTGEKGRIVAEDVKAFVKGVLTGGASSTGTVASGLPKVPVVDFAAFGAVEIKPLSRVQKISGPRLHAAWVNLPHVTQFDEADFTDVDAARNELKQKAAASGVKLTPLAFIVRGCVKALQKFPLFNASLDASGENLVVKKYIHMGFAADTPNGLLVPVIRDADRKDVYEIARHLAELSEKARAGKLTAAEMQGGCFTISSLGGIGGTAFTPIINAPEVAILGVSKSSHKPVYQNGAFVPRLMLPLSLSYDHRVIDGAAAARFTAYLAEVLADAKGLLEAVP